MGYHKLLRLKFNVDLDRMVEINYQKGIAESKVILNNWKRQCLTPFGKVTIMKTFIVSKFNHLFISLPNPSLEMVKSISDIMYQFLWTGKPDKVNRQQICQDYLDGRLG